MLIDTFFVVFKEILIGINLLFPAFQIEGFVDLLSYILDL